MELQELERAWGGIEQRLAAQDRELATLRRGAGLSKARARLRWVSLGQALQLAVGLGFVLWAGSYWWERRDTPQLLAYGLAIHAYGIALLALAVVQLVRLARIDYDAPVLAVQSQLQDLGRIRIRHERALLMAGCVMWMPFLMVVLHGFGLDVWRHSPANVWANLGVGLVLAAGAWWATRRWSARFERSAIGDALHEAQAEIGAIEERREDG
jgi:hypothetical protein